MDIWLEEIAERGYLALVFSPRLEQRKFCMARAYNLVTHRTSEVDQHGKYRSLPHVGMFGKYGDVRVWVEDSLAMPQTVNRLSRLISRTLDQYESYRG